MAFRPSKKDKMVSVDLEQLLIEDGLDGTTLYPHLDRSIGLYALFVHELATLGLDLVHAAIPTNWYHGGVAGDGLQKHKISKKLATACRPIIPINENLAAHYKAMASNKAEVA